MHLLYSLVVAFITLVALRFILGLLVGVLMNFDSTFQLSKLLRNGPYMGLISIGLASYTFFVMYFGGH